MIININELMLSSGVQFGTSGVRGLVCDMTDKVCFAYVSAFLNYLTETQAVMSGSKIGIAGDLRKSSPRIMNAAAAACLTHGFEPVNYGMIPSPAIALWGLHQHMPTIMVTGSHIPDDRNGMKFNTPKGEILKADEQDIRAQQVAINSDVFDDQDQLKTQTYLTAVDNAAEHYYVERFTEFFPIDCLKGANIGLYEHSSVSRDCLKTILESLGALVTSLGRSDAFISVDTEAIRPEDSQLAKQWAEKHTFDCIISTDGDGDRPLISDEKGNWLRGDVAGILCAKYLNADIVVTPVSSNSAVEKAKCFKKVIRTRIGSPFVIEAMQNNAIDAVLNVVGYEANGGFLQQTPITKEGNRLDALPTRDAAIVPICILLQARQQNQTISALLETLPSRFTASDRLKNFPTELSNSMLSKMRTGTAQAQFNTIKAYFPQLATPVSVDNTDGVRITLETEDVVHLRPSGNAPELRCYTEAETVERAEQLNKQCINIMSEWL